MNRTIFIVWLSAGIVVGWLVSRIYEIENKRNLKLVPVEDSDSEKS